MFRPQPISTLFPYTTLFRSLYIRSKLVETPEFLKAEKPETIPISDLLRLYPLEVVLALGISIISNASFYILAYIPTYGDRKSTRLNSSHRCISYAVFCLKKK